MSNHLLGHIIGLSHIVVAVDNLHAGEVQYGSYGYTVASRGTGKNPLEKTPFTINTMSKEYSISLLTGKSQIPLELLCEKYSVVREQNPHWKIGELETQKTFKHLFLCSFYPDLTANQFMNFGFRRVEKYIFNVSTLLSREFMKIEIIQSERELKASGLDQTGMVCLSLLCKDADKLCSALKNAQDLEFEVGGCFDLIPVSKPLRVFFARSKNGEIYEFLSPKKPA